MDVAQVFSLRNTRVALRLMSIHLPSHRLGGAVTMPHLERFRIRLHCRYKVDPSPESLFASCSLRARDRGKFAVLSTRLPRQHPGPKVITGAESVGGFTYAALSRRPEHTALTANSWWLA